MGKTKVVCPHCNKQKIQIETGYNNAFTKLKGGIWRPLLTEISALSESEWFEDPNYGMGIQCKCGRHFFAYRDENSVQTSLSLKHNQVATVYCHICRDAFVSSDLCCPSCETQF
ncbi:MAG: hypothetical protein ACW98U_15210 [Candidatus Thorarchaeota archaeon]